jgi:hypothetical protein
VQVKEVELFAERLIFPAAALAVDFDRDNHEVPLTGLFPTSVSALPCGDGILGQVRLSR